MGVRGDVEQVLVVEVRYVGVVDRLTSWNCTSAPAIVMVCGSAAS